MLTTLLLLCAYVVESAALLPISVLVTLASCAITISASSLHEGLLLLKLRPPTKPRLARRTLVTGSGTAGGLLVARALHNEGHIVVGADLEQRFLPSTARLSRAIAKFYALRSSNPSYGPWLLVKDVARIIEREHITLWINCSDQISATDCSEVQHALEKRQTACASFTLPASLAAAFQGRSKFLETLRSLGLPTPERWQVASRSEVHNHVNSANGKKKYTLASPEGTTALVLPRRTLSQTYQEVAQMRISRDDPWVLEQYLEQTERYTTFAIIVRGSLKALAVGTNVGVSSSLQAVPPKSAIGQYMTGYMGAIAERLGEEYTFQLSIDFYAIEKPTTGGYEKTLLPFDCSLQTHPARLLFSDPCQFSDLARSYLSIFDSPTNGTRPPQEVNSSHIMFPASNTAGVFYMGNELINMTLTPLWALLTLNMSLSDFLGSWVTLGRYVAYWDEAVFTLSDPLPALWVYHVCVPIQLWCEVMAKSNSGLAGYSFGTKKHAIGY